MTREEAQALAEREVLEHARNGKLKKLATQAGQSELEYAVGTLQAALPDVHRRMLSGGLFSGDIQSLAALLIEVLRECHLQHYNAVRVEPNPS